MSEFGRGCTYCIGKFLIHTFCKRKDGWGELLTSPDLWFNGASDHLIEMQIPECLPKELRDRISFFKDRYLGCSVEAADVF